MAPATPEGYLSTQGRTMFTWVLLDHHETSGNRQSDVELYYVDDDVPPSIQYQPSLASGLGFSDDKGPWGTKWFGKGALGLADGSLTFEILSSGLR